MKKKLFFMLTYMNVGGTEKAMLNLLDTIPENEYEVTLFLMEKKGGFMSCIPDWINVEVLEDYKILKPLIMDAPFSLIKKYLVEGKICFAAGLALWHMIFKITKNRFGYYKYILNRYPIRKERYDVAIAYAGPQDFITTYVLEKVKAEKKVQWIHFDVSKCGFNPEFAKAVYPKYDKIFVVSEYAAKELVKLVPNVKNEVEVRHNVVSKAICRNQAKGLPGFRDTFDGYRILTVGRLSEEKGQDMIPEILVRLKENGMKVRWYLVGEGKLEGKLKKAAAELRLEEDLVFLGLQTNPYPFYRDCDLYVQTSRHEGYCITIAEAMAFDKYIISTDVAGAREQLPEERIAACDSNSLCDKIIEFWENERKRDA